MAQMNSIVLEGDIRSVKPSIETHNGNIIYSIGLSNDMGNGNKVAILAYGYGDKMAKELKPVSKYKTARIVGKITGIGILIEHIEYLNKR